VDRGSVFEKCPVPCAFVGVLGSRRTQHTEVAGGGVGLAESVRSSAIGGIMPDGCRRRRKGPRDGGSPAECEAKGGIR
jgi:hypothetical protein